MSWKSVAIALLGWIAIVVVVLVSERSTGWNGDNLDDDYDDKTRRNNNAAWNQRQLLSEQDDDKVPLSDDFHICRLDNPKLEFGAMKLTQHESPLMERLQQQFRYQCAGPPYEEYMLQHQFPLVLERHQQDPTLQWGKRPSILPPETQNLNILVIGNSHTRQMIGSLLCMYADQIQSAHSINLKGTVDFVRRYTTILPGNHTITVLMNPSFIYSPQWQYNIEQYYLHHPLSQLDAIVMGSFNVYNPKYPTAKLWTSMERYSQLYPNQQVDPLVHPSPFDFAQLARVYNGPIVWTSMTSLYGQHYHIIAQEQMALAEFQHRIHNVQSINGRHYIMEQELLNGVECGVPALPTVGTCVQDEWDRNYHDGHKCMGAMGGLPDLVAWDVIEALWELLLLEKEEENDLKQDDDSDSEEGS